jgi:predicted dehydrogenase
MEKNLASGRDLGGDDDRIYASYAEMAQQEAARADGIDFVVIVTPNHLHFSAAKAFLEHGIHVVCDKPLTVSSAEGIALKRLATEHDCLFMVTYTYAGHAMVREARRIVTGGEIGEVTMVMAEYASDWLLGAPKKQGYKQAIWHTDPKLTGISNCVGDIGTHVENLVSFITGLKIEKRIANLDAMFTRTLKRKKAREKVDERAAGYATLNDGIEGVIFVEKCVESMRAGNVWTAM